MLLCLVSEMEPRSCALFLEPAVSYFVSGACGPGSWGCFPLKIIPAQNFLPIRMNFPDGNHPCTEFSSNQDEFPHWESSLQRNFFKSGWISLMEIIPTQQFLQIRMHFSAENHPCKEISSNQDAFLRRKSSLRRIFFKSGCISLPNHFSAFTRSFLHFPETLPEVWPEVSPEVFTAFLS